MSDIINQNTEPLFIFDMPDDEVLSQTISVQGEKGERGDPTKTSQLINDSDYTTNAALNAGLAAKADLSALQTTNTNVANNTAAIAALSANAVNIELNRVGVGSVARWYKIATLPLRNSTSYSAKINLSGCLGEYHPDKTANIDITISRRGALKVVGDYYALDDTVANYADIVIYDKEDATAELYIKAVSSWVTVKLKASFVDCSSQFDSNIYTTTEPTGTLAWALSTAPDVQKNIAGVISADITGDAASVNGHAVESDVPSDAVFTDTIYDDTSILADLESKADADDVSNTYATKAEVQSLANGSPLVASSTSEMTDTTRIYVNTTDGKWYYYDGSSWVAGGVYQTSVNSKAVDILNNENVAQKNRDINKYLINLVFEQGVVQGGTIISSTTRLSTTDVHRFSVEDVLFTIKGYLLALALYDKDGSYLGYYNTNTGIGGSPSYVDRLSFSAVMSAAPNTDNVRVMLKNSGGTTIVASEGANFYVEQGAQKAFSMINSAALDGDVIYADIWENIIFTASGSIVANDARLASRYYFPLEYIATISVADDSDMEFGIFVYDSSFAKVGYLKNASGDTATSPTYFTKLDVSSLNNNYNYRVYARYTSQSTIVASEGENIIFKPKRCNVDVEEAGVVVTNSPNSGNHIWSDYDARLSFGMDTANAPVPTINKQQLVNYGTIITMKGSALGGINNRYNRWGLHAFEAYDSSNYNRITLLTDKHSNEFTSGSKTAEFYYYTGANHHAASYGWFKIGSDVKYHSFLFNRDKMLAAGEIDCRFPITLARISPTNDLDSTYDTVEEADAAHEPEGQATSNIPCLKYLALKNASNGCMWYDEDRHKVVVKINGKWHDLNTTEVPDGTYNF